MISETVSCCRSCESWVRLDQLPSSVVRGSAILRAVAVVKSFQCAGTFAHLKKKKKSHNAAGLSSEHRCSRCSLTGHDVVFSEVSQLKKNSNKRRTRSRPNSSTDASRRRRRPRTITYFSDLKKKKYTYAHVRHRRSPVLPSKINFYAVTSLLAFNERSRMTRIRLKTTGNLNE